MYFSTMGYQHISLGDRHRLPVNADAVGAATRKDGSCILAIRMYMRRDTLARLDIPSKHSCCSRLSDD